MTSFNKIAAFSLLLLLFFSCDQNNDEQTDAGVKDTATKPPQAPPQPEDSVVTKLRTELVKIEIADLQFGGNMVSDIAISDIKYELISLKAYYEEQKSSLADLAKLSSDKEKTQKALAYLDKMIAGSDNKPDVYKVKFHLVGRAGKFNYDEMQTLFLKKDMTKLQLVFPG